MKYGYVYVGISVVIVVIGIFLIYELGLKQETLQNKDELQHLQTTEMNAIYKPTVTEDQTIQIVRSDLSRHLPNLTKVIIVGTDPLSNNPDYPKFPPHLIFELPNGTQLRINNVDYSVRAKCGSEFTDCFFMNLPLSIRGKLVYVVESEWYTTETHGSGLPTNYLIDANTGEILFSDLLKSANSSNQVRIEYKP